MLNARRRGDVARSGYARMKAVPTDDDGRIREDGRRPHTVFLFEVKSPADSRGPRDRYKIAATTPGKDAFRPLAEGGCALVRT